MEHYTKASSHAAESEKKKEVCDIHVKSGSKINNIISQAYRLLKNKEEEKIVLIGSGPTVTKTITCAEIIKRKSKGLHQLNKLFYTNIQDTWEPKEESLDRLQVTRKVPSITITLSKVPLDAALPGYQAPGKSKSPVQFGDEDWELAWDEGRKDSTKTTQKTHLEEKAKAKRKSKRFGDECNTETKTAIQETPNKGANAQSEKDADQGHLQDNICKSLEGQSERENLGTENWQAGLLQDAALESKQVQRLEVTDLENKQSCEGFQRDGVLKGKQSQEVHQKVGAVQSFQVDHVQGGTSESKQDCKEPLDIGILNIQQLQEHLEGGVVESQNTGDRCLTHNVLGSNGSHVGSLEGGVVESEQGHSKGSQWTGGAQKRSGNDGGLKTKPSPIKKQKAE